MSFSEVVVKTSKEKERRVWHKYNIDRVLSNAPLSRCLCQHLPCHHIEEERKKGASSTENFGGLCIPPFPPPQNFKDCVSNKTDMRFKTLVSLKNTER